MTDEQATLPRSREEATIGSMVAGDSGFAVPWAMYADSDGRLWLNGKYPIRGTYGGTSQMKVKCDPDGYKVDASCSDGHAWTRGDCVYAGGNHPLPVAKCKF